jgi:hypothetical protein
VSFRPSWGRRCTRAVRSWSNASIPVRDSI